MSLMKDSKGNKREWWLISIASWGQMKVLASEDEAEELRSAKCRYEHSVGHKVKLPKWVLDMIDAIEVQP